MNDNELKKRIRQASNIKLPEEARDRTRAILERYIEMMPIQKALATEYSPSFFAFFASLRRPVVLASIATVVLLGGGTAYAAENTLPGDILYPVKIHINEEVRGTLATSAKSRGEWAIARAERRLAEATALAQASRLSDETNGEVQSRLKEHIAEARAQAKRMESGRDAEGSAEVTARLTAILSAHESVLLEASTGITDTNSREQILSVLSGVRASISSGDHGARADAALSAKAKSNREEVHGAGESSRAAGERSAADGAQVATSKLAGQDEREGDVSEAALRVRAEAARRRIEIATEDILRLLPEIPEEKRSLVDARLAAARSAFDKALRERAEGSAKESLMLYTEAFRLAVEARALAQVHSRESNEANTNEISPNMENGGSIKIESADDSSVIDVRDKDRDAIENTVERILR